MDTLVLERIFCVAVMLLSALGLLGQSGILRGKRDKQMFVFYTNQSNLLIGLYAALLFFSGLGGGSVYAFVKNATVQFCLMVYILITFVIFAFVLIPALKKNHATIADINLRMRDNLCVHFAVPLLMFFLWLFTVQKAELNAANALWALLIPNIYYWLTVLTAERRAPLAPLDTPYPYPFLDKRVLGVKKLLINYAVLNAGVFALGFVLTLIGRGISVTLF